jgi:hypothetical protein
LAVKRKWPWLDDAGVYWADRDLVQALAFRGQERVRAGVPQPWPRVRRALGLQAGEILHRALEADRRRMKPADRRKAFRRAVECEQRISASSISAMCASRARPTG